MTINFTMTDRIRNFLNRRVALSRHLDAYFVSSGETIEEVFPAWLRLAYLGGGQDYRPYDLNMPAVIPRRPRAHFVADSPLTEHGKVVSEMVGVGLRLKEDAPAIARIFSAPELRAVQTAAAVARSLKQSGKGPLLIDIEPALMEWPGWADAESHSHYLSPKKYAALGYQVNEEYQPTTSIATILASAETPAGSYERMANFISNTISASKDKALLFVGGPCVLHAGRDGTWATHDEIHHIKISIPSSTVHLFSVTEQGSLLHDDQPVRPFTKTLNDVRKDKSCST